ncbi:MAG: CRTAC1 family protein [Bryobacteraceae bacterium]
MYSGWGVKFFDFDRDGDQDLVVCNGHPDDLIETLSSTLTYKEPLLLFEQANGKFQSLGSRAGTAFTGNYPARGLAVGDLDNDGLHEAVIANSGQAPLVLRHTGNSAQSGWVGLRFAGYAAGAQITWTAAGEKRFRLKTAGGSYLSASDPREILGLASARQIDLLEIKWPDGRLQQHRNVVSGRYYTIGRDGTLR